MKRLLNPGDHVTIGYDLFSNAVHFAVERKDKEKVFVGSLPFETFVDTVVKLVDNVIAIKKLKEAIENN